MTVIKNAKKEAWDSLKQVFEASSKDHIKLCILTIMSSLYISSKTSQKE